MLHPSFRFLVTGLVVAFAIAEVTACGSSSQDDLFAAVGGGTSPDGTGTGSGTGNGSGGGSGDDGTSGSTGGDAGGTTGTGDGGGKHDASAGDAAGGTDGSATDAPATGADPGVFCGTNDVTGDDVYCSVPGQYCCATGAPGSTLYDCKSSAISACTGHRLPCDDRADCGGNGQVCCGVFDQNQGYVEVSCRSGQQCVGSAGSGQTYVRLCDPSATNDECEVLGQTCQPSQSLDGYFVCKS